MIGRNGAAKMPKQSAVNQAPKPEAAPTQSNEHFVKEQLTRMSRMLRNPPTDLLQVEEYRKKLVPLAREVGQERFSASVEWCIEHLTFFPTVAEFREHVPDAQKFKGQCDPNCSHCGGTSWRYTQEHRVIRCQCWRKVPA